MKLNDLATRIKAVLGHHILQSTLLFDELTLDLVPESLLAVCHVLKETAEFKFEQLMDVCGIDYLLYGVSEWDTERSTGTGFSRGVKTDPLLEPPHHPFKERFAVVYHLLSITHGHRLRLKVFISENRLMLPSVINLWPSANWFEREVFDLFGILFENHPDLRRILTDYGFIGHPFRKDFPLSGHVEMRYSEKEGRVIYGPVEIEPRVLVPKVIRDDHRYDKV